ncbi:Crp/Fnr family transcriptional regulator [Neolewinella aurantiaca]|uniref:Crp/Fnr family transcriptional regulator n=1 Tax=Neolewinella aurantiaca TaxID=2602767 RepID=A0A5C7G0E9_9BACT|nr:Crp/Fnr family transcriptional regulator [Neolewinella aurantiaca]TXF91145.1 Crp/Fnr family transcriptional regulator [Neolewinella aurantiaca]
MADQLTISQVHQYFPDFVEPQLQEEIAKAGRLHSFLEGEIIMDYGGYVRMLPLIISGSLKITRRGPDGSELFLYYLSRGESCTMTFTCCMSEKTSEIRAVAEAPTIVLGLPREKLDEWMMKYKSWKNFVLRAYDQRLIEMMNTIDQISFSRLDQRLMQYLHNSSVINDEAVVYATHQHIADDLNVSREAISRLLKSMEKQGFVKLGRNRINIIKTLV